MKLLISPKKRSTLVGIFILTAYGVLVSAMTETRALVMIFDVLSGLSVMGIALLLYPLFRKYFPSTSATYLFLKIVEGGLMVFGGIAFLLGSTLSFRSFLYESIHLWVFIVSAFLFYILLLKTRLVPKILSIWGIAAITSLLLKSILALFNVNSIYLDMMLILIITNEVILALWVIIKGFNKGALVK